MPTSRARLQWRLNGKQSPPAGYSENRKKHQSSKRRPSAKLVAAATAPKARSAYALFLSAQSKEQTKKLSQDARRTWVSKVAKQWNSMGPEEKEVWKRQSALEYAERTKHMRLAMGKLDSQVPFKDGSDFDHATFAPTQFGQWVLVEPDRLRSPSHTCKHYLFEHKELKYLASGKLYVDHATCEVELLVRSSLPQCGQFSPAIACSKDVLPWAIFDHVCEDLAIALQRGPLGQREQLALIQQVGRGLEHLHACGWAHGNLKPAAVLWDGSRRRAMLTEFQLACKLVGEKDTQSRYTGAYRAPEHWAWSEAWKHRSQPNLPTAASDVWALACTVAEAATATKLFTEICSIQSFCESQSRAFASHNRSAGPWKVLFQLDGPLQRLLLEMLNRDPRQRMTLSLLFERLASTALPQV